MAVVAAMTDVTVSLVDIRRALAALRPHLPDPKADHLSHLGRVHVRVEEFGLLLVATNTVSAGMALVDVVDLADGEVGGTFDLSPEEVAAVLTLFKPAKVPGGEDTSSALRIRVASGLCLTDVSGLFPGRQVDLPRLDVDLGAFPAVETVLLGALLSDAWPGEPVGVDASARLVTGGVLFAAFAAAGKAYKEPLVTRWLPGARPRVLVTVGEAFVGVLGSFEPDAEQRRPEQTAVESAWEQRLVRMSLFAAHDGDLEGGA